MDERTATQLRLIGEIRDALGARSVAWWLFGGWAIDFHAGAITRDHDDVEVFVRVGDAETVAGVLSDAGFAALQGLHPDEGQPFIKDGVEVGVWYLEEGVDGRALTPGRWSDWPWRAGAFDGPPGRIGHLEVPAMTVAGLLDMKSNFATHRHGAPLRDKDIADIELLHRLSP